MNIQKRLLILPIVLFTASTGLSQQPSNSAVVPVARTEDWAMGQHESNLTSLRQPDLQVIFLGDSITHELRFMPAPNGGVEVWNEYFAPLNAAAFSVPGDKTENVLWRITEGGELDGLKPKVVVILIGVNNLASKTNSPEETAAGITAIVEQVKTRLPEAKILLLGIFPYFDPGNAEGTNEIIAKLEDLKQVYFLNLEEKMTGAGLLKDGLHPNEAGYRVWAEAMQPYLEDLLKNNGDGDLWKQRADGKPAN